MNNQRLPSLQFEQSLWLSGLLHVAGLDEAGRGAWAGPVTAAVVVLPSNNPDIYQKLNTVRDSKLMSARERAHWFSIIKDEVLFWAIGFANNQEIDRLNILRATRLAMMRALEQLPVAPEHLLIDALILRELDLPQTALIKGDQLSLSIAAASVLAKHARDCWMKEIDPVNPGYGFSSNKGYGTAIHRQALKKLGPCPIHRLSYKPLISYSQPPQRMFE
jgi:ribonuclease HII